MVFYYPFGAGGRSLHEQWQAALNRQGFLI
jgi:hypothetical protein